MWVCVERGSYLGFRDRVRVRKIGRNIVRQKRCQESSTYAYGSESSNSGAEDWLYRDRCELLRIAKQSAGEKRDVVGVSCHKDESGAV